MAYLDILLLALIAIFLVLRLRSMLGERTDSDEERQQSHRRGVFTPTATGEGSDHDDDGVVVLNVKKRGGPQKKSKARGAAEGDDLGGEKDDMMDTLRQEIGAHVLGESPPADSATMSTASDADDAPSMDHDHREAVIDTLVDIASTYPGFSLPDFITGAEHAFEMILKAYADKDTDTIRPLVAPSIFKDFREGITQRRKDGQTMVFSLLKVSAQVADASITGSTVRVTVLFLSQQVNAIVDKKGSVLEGDEKRPDYCEDTWVFEKDMKVTDPTWSLVGIH